MEEKKNNAKCPFCGAETFVGYEKGTGLCPNCRKQFDNEKAVKLFKTVHGEDEQEEKKIAKGEAYLEVDRCLERAEFYFEKKEYENARKELESALELSNTDFRIYFGLVRVETKDLTDYRNQSHEQYLNRAIAVADQDGKSTIMRLYKDFYHLSKLSDEDIEQYKKEENVAIKAKIEAKFKDIIPTYIKKERSLKTDLILFAVMAALGLGALITAIFIPSQYIIAGGVVLFFISYIFARNYVVGKKSVKLFNAVLDFYDAFDSFEYSTANRRRVLDAMRACHKQFAIKNNNNEIENAVYKLVETVCDTTEQRSAEFLRDHPVLKVYWGYFNKQEEQ